MVSVQQAGQLIHRHVFQKTAVVAASIKLKRAGSLQGRQSRLREFLIRDLTLVLNRVYSHADMRLHRERPVPC